MFTAITYRWRKASDVNREFAIFELLADEIVILDVGYSDTGIFEISFNSEINGFLVEWERLQELIEDARKIADIDRFPVETVDTRS
jgi:hypothetical protein